MSSNSSSLPTPNAAADVSFTSVQDGDARKSLDGEARPSSVGGSHTSKEKRKSISDGSSEHLNGYVHGANTNGSPKAPRSSSTRAKKSGGFLLDSLFSPSHSRDRDKAQPANGTKLANGDGNMAKRRSEHSRFSGESSHRGSPLSRELQRDDTLSNLSGSEYGSRPPSMDPSQLVQMALNLSESRKRQVSGTLPVPATASGGSGLASGLDSGYGTIRSSPSSAQRSNAMSGGTPRLPSTSAHTPHSHDERKDLSIDGTDNGYYNFSPATLSRAEKARKYFELASEHRRLLEHLPPLGSNNAVLGTAAKASSNASKSASDTARRAAAKTAEVSLGRPYNPLQALRNRRLRTRERRVLPAPPDTWQDEERVKAWIDDVAVASRDPSFRLGSDRQDLPEYSGELHGSDITHAPTTKTHRRTDTAGSVITRAENGWTIEPAELLADTYWTEQGNHKDLLEDRRGHLICPSQTRHSSDNPRHSMPNDRGEEVALDGRSQKSMSGDDGKVRHRRRNKIPIAGRIRRHRLPHLNRSASVTSLSSDEGRYPPPLLFGNNNGGDENIGPLERHMRDMIAQDAKEELSSPELPSPDRWDAHNSRLPASRSNIDRRLRDAGHHASGRLSVEVHKHRRTRSAEGRVGSVDHGISSMDEFASDTPSSPVIPTFIPPMGIDLSSPPSQQRSSTPDRKARNNRLPIFRSRSKERNHIEQNDFAENPAAVPLSPVLSGQQKETGTKDSLDVPRPGPPKRHRTTESITSSLRRLNTASTSNATESSAKDSGTGSGHRFFKGGRIGELVRNEGSRFGDRFRPRDRNTEAAMASDVSRAASDVSDTEDSNGQQARWSQVGSPEDSEASPRNSFEKDGQTPRYFLPNLPIFSSSAAKDKRPTLQSTESDPITTQQRAQREAGRSQRFQRLAPPKINLPDDEQDLDPENADRSGKSSEPKRRWGNLRIRSPSTSRKNSAVSLGAPGSIAHTNGHLPVTGLYGVVSSESKRHWSISDQAQPEQVKKVTMRDIARVRALLLSSGVKAHEIGRLANLPRDSPAPDIVKAAATVGKDVHGVPWREEIVVVSRMLSDHISNTTSDFDRSLVNFRNGNAKTLTAQLEHLQRRAGDQLTTLVHETSDNADAFTIELTTKQPQDVKRVEDAVDYMFRQRRRRFRLVRRTGFKMLEWMLLGIMWWVWFVVVIFKTARRILWTVFVFLRWLLWF